MGSKFSLPEPVVGGVWDSSSRFRQEKCFGYFCKHDMRFIFGARIAIPYT